MSDRSEAVNAAIRAESPALFDALSPLGRRAFFPPDIPFQAAEARGKAFNGTIGQVTDGAGRGLALPSIEQALAGLDEDDRNRSLLYSPLEGVPEVRTTWRQWQRRGIDESVPSTDPLVTVGLSHALSIAADLFGGEGRPVAVPSPFWGNYRQTFSLRTGTDMVSAPGFVDGRFNVQIFEQALAGSSASPESPAVVMLNFPSNPGGYSPTDSEREALAQSLVGLAETRPIVAICDDAYAGMVYEEGIAARSMFWDLVDRHPNLIPVKIDGVTKELFYFGGRVGFITFPFAPDSAITAALTNKVKGLLRAAIGSPVATSQIVALQALRASSLEAQVGELRDVLANRYRVLSKALDGVDQNLLGPMPFNSGCFALLELRDDLVEQGLTAEAVRRQLLDHEDTGIVAIAPKYLRIAFCSVNAEALPELVKRIERGVATLSDRRTRSASD